MKQFVVSRNYETTQYRCEQWIIDADTEAEAITLASCTLPHHDELGDEFIEVGNFLAEEITIIEDIGEWKSLPVEEDING